MTPAPNIILVIADDMGYGDFGIFNSQISCTPTLDALAQLELDGVNPRRFWQWNRYTPMISCNAAMRDGDWKLLRPRIPAAMLSDLEAWFRDVEQDRRRPLD